MKIVYDSQGNRINLDPIGKGGGEGSLYRNIDNGNECAKIYHDHRINNEIHEKIIAMVNNPPDDPTFRSQKHHSIAWPISPLYADTAKSQFLGFTMPYFSPDIFQESFKYFSYSDRIGRFKGDFNWKYLIHSAFNVSSAVAALHKKKHRIGDLRDSNIFVSPKALVTIIDCDSFQIYDNRHEKTYYCRVGTGEYLAPEIMERDFKNENIDRYYSDLFALGIIIFKFLMGGFHPFASRGAKVADAPTTIDKILKGYFAYGYQDPDLEPPKNAPFYSMVIPPDIQTLFHRCFILGHKNVQERPTADEWFQALKGYII